MHQGMEIAARKQRRNVSNDPASRKPRLLTPEESRSSHESYDSDPQDERRRRPTVQKLPRPPSVERSAHSDELTVGRNSRRDSCTYGAANSPPYQSSDDQRPSLPPLKTVLGDSMTSPPQTPNMRSMSLQPSPREPTYTSTTYKPPSLYPNKKPRTDFVLEPVPPFTNPSSHRHGFSHSDSNQTSRSTNPSLAVSNRPEERHSSAQALREPGRVNSPSAVANTPFSTRREFSDSMSPTHNAMQNGFNEPRREPDFKERRWNPVESSARIYDGSRFAASCDLSQSSGPRASQIPSTIYRDELHQEEFASERDARYSYYPEPRRDLPIHPPPAHRESSYQTAPGKMYPPQVSHELSHSQYDSSSRPSFFLPNHYDYQQGKARKRSNLPKQSTEIMKTWFDQNISNPYPSEEQKAIFSNATGISMTQVSNWFINHRRRCPELRDKRDKARPREFDG